MKRLAPAMLAVLGAGAGCGGDAAAPPHPATAPAVAAAGAPEPAPGPPAAPAAPRPLPEALRQVVALTERGRFAEARGQAEAYRAAHPGDAQGVFVEALTYHRARDYAAAEPRLVRALELDPTYAVVQHFLGYCRFYLGDLRGARAAFEGHLRAVPDESDSHFGLGLVDLEEGHLDEAEARFHRAIALIEALERSDPDRARLRRGDLAKCYARLADVAFARAAYTEARALLHQAVAIDPNQYAAYFQLSQIERRLGNDDEAERLQGLFEQMAAVRQRRRPPEQER